jgi:NAD dependent epimerase/dehydratase family enzyme
MSWISLDDMVEAIVFLIEHDEIGGPVNMTAPNPVTNRDLTAALSRVLHRPALLPVPKFGPALLMGKEMTDAMIFDSIRVEPARLVAAGFRFLHPDIDAALRATLGD